MAESDEAGSDSEMKRKAVRGACVTARDELDRILGGRRYGGEDYSLTEDYMLSLSLVYSAVSHAMMLSYGRPEFLIKLSDQLPISGPTLERTGANGSLISKPLPVTPSQPTESVGSRSFKCAYCDLAVTVTLKAP